MWTDSQKNAINAPVGNILVTAAAGSGKTAVMIERIMSRVLDKNGVDIDKILVVTYTNAAASEIKERLQLNIMKKLNENPQDARLNKQLVLIDNAKICTIHSLCLDIIKKYFYKIDLDPAFKIGDVLEIEDIKSKAINEVFESYYENNDKLFLQLVDEFCAGQKTDNALVDVVTKIYNFSLSVPNPEKWLKSCIEIYENNDFDLHNMIIVNSIKNYIEYARILCNNSINMCERYNELQCMPVLSSDLDVICDLIDNSNTLSDIYEKINSVKFMTFSKSYKKDVSDALLEKITSNRDEIKKIVKKSLSKITVTEKDFEEDCKILAPKVKKLCEIAKAIHTAFSDKKRDKKLIDFSDFEHFALKVLEDENGNKTDEAKILSQSISEIYIDEYQDCNHIQDRIFYLLSQCENDNPNIFMVGDVKQSIYKFRDAAPMLFMQKMKSYPDFSLGNKYSKISLSKNFRSRREILNFTNFIFKQIMSEEVGEIEYTDYLIENENDEYKQTDDVFKSVNIAILSDDGYTNIQKQTQDDAYDTDETDFSDEELLDNSECEANFIASKIKELISSKIKIYDKSLKQKRHISYKDIVVLLRSTKGRTQVFEKVFNELSIPTFSDTTASYYSSIEIATILNYIKIIVNPIDDINLVAVLRSGIYNFTDEELLKIRMCDSFDYFYYALIKYAKNNHDKLAKKIDNFIKITSELKDASKYLPTDEFIWELLKRTDYLLYVSTLPDSKEKKLNIRLLINKASLFENTEFKGIFNFTKFVDDIIARNSDTDAAKIVSENDDLVRIMSIHKSKGLEFPVVFLAQCGKKFNFTDERTKVLCHKDLGIGIDFIDYKKRFMYTPNVKKSIAEKLHIETLSEEERILYVALTRAREKLYITGIINNAKQYIEKVSAILCNNSDENLPCQLTTNANSYFDWIIPAIMRHENCSNLFDAFSNIKFINNENSNITCEIISKDDYSYIKKSEAESEKQIIIPDSPSDSYDEIERRMSYVYETSTNDIPTNVTVTELKKMMESDANGYWLYQKEYVSRPKFVAQKNAAQFGSMIHLLLQKLDFSTVKSIDDIKHQLDLLVKSGIISSDDAKLVDPSIIYDFCASELGKSISSSNVYKEVPFKIEENSSEIFGDDTLDDKIIIQGVIDLFYYDKDGQVILVDYKTDKLSEEQLVKKYEIQLKIYAKALKKITGKDVYKMHIYSFHNKKDIIL